MKFLSPSLHLLVLTYCRLFRHPHPHCSGSPALQASLSIRPTALASIFLDVSLASNLGLVNLNSHLLGVLLQVVKCHSLTQDAESPLGDVNKKNLLPPFGQAFYTWNQAAVKNLGWGGVKGKKRGIMEKHKLYGFSDNWNTAWGGTSGIPL